MYHFFTKHHISHLCKILQKDVKEGMMKTCGSISHKLTVSMPADDAAKDKRPLSLTAFCLYALGNLD